MRRGKDVVLMYWSSGSMPCLQLPLPSFLPSTFPWSYKRDTNLKLPPHHIPQRSPTFTGTSIKHWSDGMFFLVHYHQWEEWRKKAQLANSFRWGGGDGGIGNKNRSRPFGIVNFNAAIPTCGGQGRKRKGHESKERSENNKADSFCVPGRETSQGERGRFLAMGLTAQDPIQDWSHFKDAFFLPHDNGAC